MRRKTSVWSILLVACAVLWLGSSMAAAATKLHIMFMEPWPPNVKYAESVIDDFKKANPDVEVNLEPLGFGGFMSKITALKAAGNPPDIIYTIPGHMWTFQLKDWLEPMDDVIAGLGGDDYFEPLPGYTQKDGHFWGVPVSSYSMHLEYRKDLFDAKGLAEPRTWAQLLEAAKALTEDLDGDGQIDRYGIALPLKKDYALGVSFLGFLWGNGGHVLDKDGKVAFNSPETVETLKFMKELYQYAPPGVSGYSWMELVSTYVQDKVAITTFSAMKPLGDAINANEAIAQNTRLCAIPTRLETQQSRARWANMAWLVSKDSQNKDMAKKFISFWMQPDRLVGYYNIDPIFVAPGETPVIQSALYWDNPLLNEYKSAIEKMVELNKETGVDPAMEHPGVLQPNTSLINQRLLIAECVQEVVLGGVSAEEAAAKAHKKMERLIAKQD